VLKEKQGDQMSFSKIANSFFGNINALLTVEKSSPKIWATSEIF
jgi:hypothetical protein